MACTSCGASAPRYNSNCPECGGSHVHGAKSPYQHAHRHDHHHGYYPPYPPPLYPNPNYPGAGISPAVCPPDNDDNGCGIIYAQNSGPARPIAYGFFQAFCKDGSPAPFAKVTVTYAGTQTLAAIYSHPRGANEDLIANPATTDYAGRVQMYFKGGPVEVTVEDENGCAIDHFTNYGGFVDGDFPLSDATIKDCIDIDMPLVRIYDGDNCNVPDSMTSPTAMVMWGLWKTGQPIGAYSDAVDFFACVGVDFPCDIVVYGDTDGKRYKYNCVDCNVGVPPNPEEVDFDCSGFSECWTDINLQDVAQLAGQTSAYARWRAEVALPDTTNSLLLFDESGGDPSFFDAGNPDAFTIPADGPYLLGATAGVQLGGASLADASDLRLICIVNGNFGSPHYLNMIDKSNSTIADMVLSGTWSEIMSEGDTVQFYIFADWSGNQSDVRYPSVDSVSSGFSGWIQRFVENC